MSAEAVRHYAAAQAAQQAPAADWLAALRRQGMATFTSAGFPTSRDEAWKYTSLQAVERRRFLPAQGASLAADVVDRLGIAWPEGPRLVFVNGVFQASTSSPLECSGVRVTTLARMLEQAPERVRRRLGSIADAATHRFVALSNAFVADGAWIELGRGAELAEPIYLLFVSAPEAQEALVQPRVVIDAGAGARVAVVEHHVNAGAAPNLSNVVTELNAGPDAHIEHDFLLEGGEAGFHVAALHARLERGSVLHGRAGSAGARLARRDLHCVLAGEGADVTLDGLFVAAARSHNDQHLRIEHAVPHTRSRIDYRGIAEAHGRGVFGGKVVVCPNAQHADAHQSSRNLLLAPQAEIDTRPELEIYADDVKCSHGATVGQLDADAIFYLRARGLDEAHARAVLTFAFAQALIERCPHAPVRARFAGLLAAALGDRSGLTEELQ